MSVLGVVPTQLMLGPVCSEVAMQQPQHKASPSSRKANVGEAGNAAACWRSAVATNKDTRPVP